MEANVKAVFMAAKCYIIRVKQVRTPAAVSGYHLSSAKLAFWIQYIIARLL